MQTEWMDEKEFDKFEKELHAEPGRKVNTGVSELMGVLMGAGKR